MIACLKYELAKLFSIRSTYIMSLLAAAFSVLMVVISVVNYKPGSLGSTTLAQLIFDTPLVASIIGSIAAILLVGHEYRYNTIAYTLTASRSRAKVLLAKATVTILFSAGLAAACIGIGIMCFYIGISFKEITLPPQNFELWDAVLRSVLSCVGDALLGLVIALLVRNIIFAIAAIFMLPTIEQVLSIWLKDNAAYLPSHALQQLSYIPGQAGAVFSPLKGGLIFLAYLAVGGAIAWLLFLRRDAS